MKHWDIRWLDDKHVQLVYRQKMKMYYERNLKVQNLKRKECQACIESIRKDPVKIA